jgi:hypothetical protein
MARDITAKLLEMIEDGALDKDIVIQAFCEYLSEDDIKDFVSVNDFIEPEPDYVEDYDEPSDFIDDDFNDNYQD